MVGGSGGRVVGLGLGVDGHALVGHIGDVAVVVVGGVAHVLGPAVGKGHGVGAGHGTVGIAGLGGVEGGLGVVVGHTVLVGVGSGLLLVHGGGGVDNGGLVGGGVVDDGSGVVDDGRSVVDDGRGVVDDGGGVVDGVGHGMGHEGSVVGQTVVDQGSGVVGQTVVDQRGVVGHSVVGSAVDDSTVGGGDLGQTLAVVHLVDGGVAGTEGLGDLDAPHLAVSLGDRLVGGLTAGRAVQLGGAGSNSQQGRHAHKSLKQKTECQYFSSRRKRLIFERVKNCLKLKIYFFPLF